MLGAEASVPVAQPPVEVIEELGTALTSLAFVALAATSVMQWRQRRGEPTKWAALTFGLLGAVAVLGWLTPERGGQFADWSGNIAIAAFVTVPYCLYRFTTAFGDRSRRGEWTAASAVAAVVVATLALRDTPGGKEQPEWLGLYVFALLALWTVLPATAALRLWWSGRGQPTVVQARMRLLSVASMAMSIALVTAGAVAQQGWQSGELVAQLFALCRAALFFAGLAPPAFLLAAWRRRAEGDLHRAIQGLMAATSEDEVMAGLLPNAVAIVGGRAAALLEQDGRVLGRWGLDPGASGRAAPELAVSTTRSNSGQDEIEGRLDVPLRSGRLVVFASPYTPFFGEDELERLRSLGGLLDIALQRVRLSEELKSAKEEAERANQNKSEFLSRISHELRTPLTAILGFSQLLSMRQLSPDERKSVEHIERAGRQLLDLINELLDIARIEAGKLVLRQEPVSVEDLVVEAFELVAPLGAQRSVHMQTEGLGNCGLSVTGDRQRLRQVMLNLLSNAIKYTEPGGQVTLSCQPVQADSVRLVVSDTGRGIAPERLQRLFEPFDRLGVEETEVEGAGLGLYLSKKLVEAMGGTLQVESVVGRGSSFWVELRLDPQLTQSLPSG